MIILIIYQIQRNPRPFPSLKITKPRWDFKQHLQTMTRQEIVDRLVKELESFEFTDFVLEGYQPHAKIQMKMSA
jgi:thymidylate synthase